jgi:hypothetical protein
MFTKAFWAASGERAAKTFAQTLASLLLAAGTGLLDTAWTTSLSVAGMATLLSLLTSVGSSSIGNSGPSLSTETVTP